MLIYLMTHFKSCSVCFLFEMNCALKRHSVSVSATKSQLQLLQLLPTSEASPHSMNAVESDDDSGIVAIANGMRIDSTIDSTIDSNASNSDEDNNYKEKVSHRTNQQSCGPKNRVRFDDELHLSEQNMRKSCKKLFATLFNQNNDNYEEDSHNSSNFCENNSSADKHSLLPSCHCHYFAQTLPHKKTSQSMASVVKSRTNSELNLNIDINDELNRSDALLSNKKSGLLLQTVTQHSAAKDVLQSNECPYSKVKESNSSNQMCQSNDIRVGCNAALSKIKAMTDRLESSSMVNAFARPVLIQNCRPVDKDCIYETIFPIHNKYEAKMYSSKGQIKKWLNSDKVESINNNIHVIDEPNNEKLASSLTLADSESQKSSLLKCRKSILKTMPTITTIPEINVNASANTQLEATNKAALISPDEIYPNRDECSLTDEEESENESKQLSYEYSPLSKLKASQRFCNSYSAGDEKTHRIRGPNQLLKAAISETNLNQKSPNQKSFLQRFKSAISRAFTNEKLTKHLSESSKQSHSISHSDLRINGNASACVSARVTRINKSDIEKSPSFVKNLKTRISIKRNMREKSPQRKMQLNDEFVRHEKEKTAVASQLHLNRLHSNGLHSNRLECESSDSSVWAELIKLNCDSSQIIQIHRRKGKAFGFFVARGTVNNVKGVFVSRMKDEDIQKSLVGVLEIGDEILAIDGESVKDGNIMKVNQLIANKETIRLTIIPYMNNKYL